MLCEEVAHAIRAMDVVLDGEVVCTDPDGRSNFHKLLRRREWPYYFVFDVLRLEGRDVRALPLVERKRLLRGIMPRVESRVQFVDAIETRGDDFFRVVCERDLEGIVAKPKYGPYYSDGVRTNWLKIKNPTYSQTVGRDQLFASDAFPRRRRGRPQLMLPVVMDTPPRS